MERGVPLRVPELHGGAAVDEEERNHLGVPRRPGLADGAVERGGVAPVEVVFGAQGDAGGVGAALARLPRGGPRGVGWSSMRHIAVLRAGAAAEGLGREAAGGGRERTPPERAVPQRRQEESAPGGGGGGRPSGSAPPWRSARTASGWPPRTASASGHVPAVGLTTLRSALCAARAPITPAWPFRAALRAEGVRRRLE